MKHDTAPFETSDGLTLFTRTWTPGDARAVVVLVHGVHEHSGRYAYPASLLMGRGFEVRALDLRGHGQSGGPRWTVDAFGEYADDVASYLLAVRSSTEQPVFLLGHSMGGLVAASTVVRHGADGLAGLVLSSPALGIPETTSPLLRRIAPLVARWAPGLPTTRLDLTRLSRDPAVARAYREDPLVRMGGVRARLGYEILRDIERVRQHPEAFTLPLYLFHGTADQITDPAGSRWLYEHAPSTDKTLRLWDGLRHETMNEPEREAVVGELADWLDAHAEAA